MTDYKSQADSAAYWLELAGLNVRRFKVNAVAVVINGKNYFIILDDTKYYGIKLFKHKIVLCNNCVVVIRLQFNNTVCTLYSHSAYINISGVVYERPSCNYYIGRLYGNMYTNYLDENALIRRDSFTCCDNYKFILGVPPRIDEVLSINDLLPIPPKIVDIKNEGVKLVKYEIVSFQDYDDDEYGYRIQDCPSGPFRYRDINTGELFALLVDEDTGESRLAGANRSIKVSDTRLCEVRYNVIYKIFDDAKFAQYEYFDSMNPLYPCIPCLKYSIFAYDGNGHVELDLIE
jgi:hypothetical protein